jgi:hypothetical protein
MGRVGRGADIGRTLARVLDAQERRDDQQLAHSTEALRFDQHARQRYVDGNARHHAPGISQPALVVDRAEFGQSPVTVANRARIRRLDKREFLDVTEFQREHAQDNAAE